MAESQDSIQVHVRIRGAQPGSIYFEHTPKSIKLGKNNFAFDEIYAPEVGQTEIFSLTGLKSITHALEGYNSCIFVYGQTGSGKTYTMVGGDGGIIQRAMEHLFYQISESSDANYVVGCSYYEIYNEHLFDLLDHNEKKKLNIREDIKKGIFIEGLHEENIDTSGKGMSLLNQGIRSRHVAETMMNRESSRSHAIFSLNIQSKHVVKGNTTLKTSKLHFVDLAGSERQKATACVGERLKQASNINKSLTTLGMVINSLSSEKPKSHIPFRDSKLTLVLRDSLNGNSKTYLIATISSNPDSFQETLSTLKFAQRAKMVKLKAQINEESLSMNVQTLKEEIRRLKEENRDILANLETEKHRVKSQSEVSGYNEAILNNYNSNVAEINEKINTLVQLLPKVIDSTDGTTMETINQHLDTIIGLRQQIITKVKVETLRFQQLPTHRTPETHSEEAKTLKQNIDGWKSKAKELGDEVLEKEKEKGDLFGKIKENVKEIGVLKEENEILKYALETKEGKGAAETVKNLLRQTLNPVCSSCKEADTFIMKLSNDIVTLRKSVNSLQVEHQGEKEEHEFLKISYKNLQEESDRRMRVMVKEEGILRQQITELVEKKKEDMKGLMCSVNGKQVSAMALSARVRELENINQELSSELDVLRETIEFRNQQIEELKNKPVVLEKENLVPLKDLVVNRESVEGGWKKEGKVGEIERELKVALEDLGNAREEIAQLKKMGEESRKGESAYSSLLEKITNEHENLVVATKVVEDELRKKIGSLEMELEQRGEEMTKLRQVNAGYLEQVGITSETLKSKEREILDLTQTNSEHTSLQSQLALSQQQLSTLKSTIQSLTHQLTDSKSALDIYMHSIQSCQLNSQARTKQAQQLRVTNHDLTLKNNRYQFLIKQREGDMMLVHNEIVSKRKEVVEYVEKFLGCQKEKEEVERRLTEVTIRHEGEVVPLYQENMRLKQLLHEKQAMFHPSFPTQRQHTQVSQISQSASKAHREQIQQLKRIIGDRERHCEDIYRLKKEADYKIYSEREETNRSIGVYMNEISILKEKILYLETESLEYGSAKSKYQSQIDELKRELRRKEPII